MPPSKITVSKLQFDTRMNEEGGWANTEGRFRFDKLAYGDDTYGPLDITRRRRTPPYRIVAGV